MGDDEQIRTATPGVPLCVELRGGLLHTSLLAEGVLFAAKREPSLSFRMPFWWLRGRAVLEREVERRHPLDPETLPYDPTTLASLREARADGRATILVTSSHPISARAISDHLGLFDEVMATDQLEPRFGTGGFDFVGPRAAADQLGRSARTTAVAHRPDIVTSLRLVVRALRPHQWLKNLLVFVPVLAGQRYSDPTAVLHAVLAFVAFSLAASSVYVTNDIFDLDHDRRHPTKRDRPFASGGLRITRSIPLVIALLLVAALVSSQVTREFQGILAFYLVVTLAYSLKLKGTVLIDVLTLAGLYTVRIVAGALATGIELSVWLLGFSLFFFFSLALVKRYAELHAAGTTESLESEATLPGRGYQARDLPILIALGVGSGCMSVLVLALYVISDEFARHYSHPVLLWQLCPLALYWVGRAWIVVARDEMTDDPVVWAFRDQLSRWIAVVAIAILFLAR